MGSAAKAHAGLASELAQAEIRPCVRDDFSYLGVRVLVPPLADGDSDYFVFVERI